MKLNYETLSEITVESQIEFDSIPWNFKGVIYVEFGTIDVPAVIEDAYHRKIVIKGSSHALILSNSNVKARDNSEVEARDNSKVEATDFSRVVASDSSSVVAWEGSLVYAYKNSSVEAWDNVQVIAWGNSDIVVVGRSTVEANENSTVVAWSNSVVVASDSSSVVAWGNSVVTLYNESSAEVHKRSTVIACNNSTVEAWDDSTVEANENSCIVANSNVQVVDCSWSAKIEIKGNARIVYKAKTIYKFMDLYGIKYDEESAIFFKAVHKIKGCYISQYDNDFEYKIGKIKTEKCDENENACGTGIYISDLNWALNFADGWDDVAILEVKTRIDNIVLARFSDGIVRTSEVKVLREVPLNECGIYGKILGNRLNK